MSLSDAAFEVLRRVGEFSSNSFIFPGQRPGRKIADRTLHQYVEGRDATLHGMRSSFRNWAGEQGIAREIAESALAHATGGAVERAYLRTNFFGATQGGDGEMGGLFERSKGV